MKISSFSGELPQTPIFAAAEKAVAVLHKAGYKAYFVGGAVRDLLLGRTPDDVDVTTSARPEAVRTPDVRREADPRRFHIRWTPSPTADGYLLRWGVRPDELYSACEVYEPEAELGCFSVGQRYYFRVDAFNEGGVTPGQRTEMNF